ncbi:hypothetical protein A0H81_14835 [Grifola frondosa]|uniref:Uncharacterized protein n=1 Tax=Grifola frondosa TaxID=5627 RepID=A0A1C7LMJ6_GRIFR|nr:hypothetical protein A0H81_14835 [Grifola frondosa]
MSFPVADLSGASPRSAADQAFSYNLDDVDRISSRLGIPWQHSKDIDFANEFPYTGFLWNIEAQTVAIPRTKCEKYLAAIHEWQASRTHTLQQVQRLYGKLLHASLVVRAGRAYLTNLEAMLSIFHDRPFLPRTPPSSTPADLQWWQKPSRNPPWPGISLAPWRYSTSGPSLTRVPESASASSLENTGAHGDSFPDGSAIIETSAGPKQSGLSSSSSPSSRSAYGTPTLKYSEIVASLKGGGTEGVVIAKSTVSSSASTSSWDVRTKPFTLDTSQVPRTLPMAPLEASSLPLLSSFPGSHSPRHR